MPNDLVAILRTAPLEAEAARITRQFEAAGGFGLTAAEKAERLAELRQQLRRLQAPRELEDLVLKSLAGRFVAELERAAEAAAPGRAHIAWHPHRLPRTEAKIEGCNFKRIHRWCRQLAGRRLAYLSA
jgi:hypothetical protein